MTLKAQQSFEGAIESDEEEWPSVKPDLTGIWIVEIDDEADARELLAVVLEQWGAKVTATASGDEVVTLIEGDSGRGSTRCAHRRHSDAGPGRVCLDTQNQGSPFRTEAERFLLSL